MSDPKDHNPQAAGIYRAIALRFYSRYVEARENAERHGGNLSGYGSQHDAREADERYKVAIDEAIGEIPESIDAALALAHFAGILAADRFVGEITQEPVNDERAAITNGTWPTWHDGSINWRSTSLSSRSGAK